MRDAPIGQWLDLLFTKPKFVLRLAKATSIEATAADFASSAERPVQVRGPSPDTPQHSFAAERCITRDRPDASYAAVDVVNLIDDEPLARFPLVAATLTGAMPVRDLLLSCPKFRWRAYRRHRPARGCAYCRSEDLSAARVTTHVLICDRWRPTLLGSMGLQLWPHFTHAQWVCVGSACACTLAA